MIYLVIYDRFDAEAYKIDSIYFCPTLGIAQRVGLEVTGDGCFEEWCQEGPACWALGDTDTIIKGEKLEGEVE